MARKNRSQHWGWQNRGVVTAGPLVSSSPPSSAPTQSLTLERENDPRGRSPTRSIIRPRSRTCSPMARSRSIQSWLSRSRAPSVASIAASQARAPNRYDTPVLATAYSSPIPASPYPLSVHELPMEACATSGVPSSATSGAPSRAASVALSGAGGMAPPLLPATQSVVSLEASVTIAERLFPLHTSLLRQYAAARAAISKLRTADASTLGLSAFVPVVVVVGPNVDMRNALIAALTGFKVDGGQYPGDSRTWAVAYSDGDYKNLLGDVRCDVGSQQHINLVPHGATVDIIVEEIFDVKTFNTQLSEHAQKPSSVVIFADHQTGNIFAEQGLDVVTEMFPSDRGLVLRTDKDENMEAVLNRGINTLCEMLSNLFSTCINDTTLLLKKRIASIDSDVKILPPPISDPSTVLSKIIIDFTNDLREAMSTTKSRVVIDAPPTESKSFEDLRERIAAREPAFRVHSPQPLRSIDTWGNVVVERSPSPAPSQYRLPEDVLLGLVSPPPRPVVTLDEMNKRLVDAITSELPGHFPSDRVCKDIILATTSSWREPVDEYLDAVLLSCVSITRDIINTHFDAYSKTGLRSEVAKLTGKMIMDCYEATRSVANMLLTAEETIRVENDDAFLTLKDSHYSRLSSTVPTPRSRSDQLRQSAALDVMATTGAYFEVSQNRFLESIRRTVYVHLLGAFSGTLVGEIMRALNLTQAEKWLVAKQSLATSRFELEERVAIMKSVRTALFTASLS